MKNQRIYIDTSVIGGYFDIEFEKATKVFFAKAQQAKYSIVISDITESELFNAPENVRNLLHQFNIPMLETITLSDEAIDLAEEYIKEQVIGETSRNDCLHIALATVQNIDVLVSWNFKHIVNVKRIRNYNSINVKNGYLVLDIRSPQEVIDYEE